MAPSAEGSAAGGWARDAAFMMYRYKVEPCSRGDSHDWARCPFAHARERSRRRDPARFPYSSQPCPYTLQGQTCPRGAACPRSHGVLEYWCHPDRYLTQMCKLGTRCMRPLCFFAHRSSELRFPPAGADPGPGRGLPPDAAVPPEAEAAAAAAAAAAAVASPLGGARGSSAQGSSGGHALLVLGAASADAAGGAACPSLSSPSAVQAPAGWSPPQAGLAGLAPAPSFGPAVPAASPRPAAYIVQSAGTYGGVICSAAGAGVAPPQFLPQHFAAGPPQPQLRPQLLPPQLVQPQAAPQRPPLAHAGPPVVWTLQSGPEACPAPAWQGVAPPGSAAAAAAAAAELHKPAWAAALPPQLPASAAPLAAAQAAAPLGPMNPAGYAAQAAPAPWQQVLVASGSPQIGFAGAAGWQGALLPPLAGDTSGAAWEFPACTGPQPPPAF